MLFSSNSYVPLKKSRKTYYLERTQSDLIIATKNVKVRTKTISIYLSIHSEAFVALEKTRKRFHWHENKGARSEIEWDLFQLNALRTT